MTRAPKGTRQVKAAPAKTTVAQERTLSAEPKFSLWSDPWIEVLKLDGSSEVLSFRETLLQSRNIRRIDSTNPLCEVVTLRMLIALLLRTMSAPMKAADVPKWNEWAADVLREGVSPDAVEEYGNRFANRFWLLGGETPFLQDVSIAAESEKLTSTNKLRMDVQSGNNPLFTTKIPDSGAGVLPFDKSAQALLVQWGFAAGGGTGTRSGVGTCPAGPLRASALYALEGRNLLETMVLNAVPARGDEEWASGDKCHWELGKGETATSGILGRLTSSNRGILLFGTDDGVDALCFTWGSKLPDNFLLHDPMVMRRWLLASPSNEPIAHRLKLNDYAWATSAALTSGIAARRWERVKVGRRGMFFDPPAVLDPARYLEAAPLLRDTYDAAGTTVYAHLGDTAKDLGWLRGSLGPLLRISSRAERAKRARLRRFLNGVERITDRFEDQLSLALANPETPAARGSLDKKNAQHSRNRDAAANWTPRLWATASTSYARLVEYDDTAFDERQALQELAKEALLVFQHATDFSVVGDLRRVQQSEMSGLYLKSALRGYLDQETK